jgi:hypothetical protein
MKPMISEQCEECVHFLWFKRGFKFAICEAFPDGIPVDICSGEFDHNNPYPNANNPEDNGIRFKAIEEER